MKRRISDLMDYIPGGDMEFEMHAPLSSERIRELTMDRITENNAPKKRGGLFRIIMVAAIVAGLSISVFAAEKGMDWFVGFFTKNSGSELSDGQIEYINENTILLDQNQTVGEYTVTLESCFGEGSVAYFKVKVQAPEGTAVSEKGYEFGNIEAVYSDGEPVCGFLSWKLQELDKETSSAIHVLDLDYILDDGNSCRNEPITLELRDLYDGQGQLLAKGSWRFEITLPDTAMELIEEPITGKQMRNQAGDTIEVTVTSVSLRGMGVRITYAPPFAGTPDSCQLGVVKAVMLDGTTMELIPCGVGRNTDAEDTTWWAEFCGGIIVVEEVAYIELPDGTRLPVNME